VNIAAKRRKAKIKCGKISITGISKVRPRNGGTGKVNNTGSNNVGKGIIKSKFDFDGLKNVAISFALNIIKIATRRSIHSNITLVKLRIDISNP